LEQPDKLEKIAISTTVSMSHSTCSRVLAAVTVYLST